MKLYLIPIIILVFALPVVFADQVSPHMRCDPLTEKQTWDEELQKHDCIAVTFVKPETPTCSKVVYDLSYFFSFQPDSLFENYYTNNTIIKESPDYIWVQTGPQSYEQIDCNKAVTKIEVKLDTWDLWEQYAWDFVFGDRYGW